MDEWEDLGKFYEIRTRELNTVQGNRHPCSPKVGHLVPLYVPVPCNLFTTSIRRMWTIFTATTKARSGP
jgi:hypothetical protein